MVGELVEQVFDGEFPEAVGVLHELDVFTLHQELFAGQESLKKLGIDVAGRGEVVPS